MCIVFFKQKTAYEVRISDWSSGVCSSDLSEGGVFTYIRVMRLKAAFDALRDPHQASLTIQDIARKAGYDSDAFFCRAFKSMFDVTPGELRRAAEMAAPKLDRKSTRLNSSH